jgi:hypothetical protein
MYSTERGRFLQRDPIGYVDGLNLYAAYFVPNDVDPTGLRGDDRKPPTPQKPPSDSDSGKTCEDDELKDCKRWKKDKTDEETKVRCAVYIKGSSRCTLKIARYEWKKSVFLKWVIEAFKAKKCPEFKEDAHKEGDKTKDYSVCEQGSDALDRLYPGENCVGSTSWREQQSQWRGEK